MKLLPLLLLCGCATQMTEAEREYREYFEQERVVAYRIWEQACHDAGGVIYVNNPHKPCIRSECIPHEVDWSHERRHNRAQCVKLSR